MTDTALIVEGLALLSTSIDHASWVVLLGLVLNGLMR